MSYQFIFYLRLIQRDKIHLSGGQNLELQSMIVQPLLSKVHNISYK